MQVILSPLQSVLMIAAYAVGIYVVWWVSKKGVQWIQAYRDKQHAIESTRIKDETAHAAQKAQDDSDALKKIEGR